MPTPSPFVWKTASGQTVDQGFTAEWHPSTIGSSNTPPTANVVWPPDGAELIAGETYTFQLSASDADGTIAGNASVIIDGNVSSQGAAVFNAETGYYERDLMFGPGLLGPHTVAGRVTDDDGATTTSAARNVTVVAATGTTHSVVFNTGTAGQLPPNTALRWDAQAGDFVMADVASPLGAKLVRSALPQTNNRAALTLISAGASAAGERVNAVVLLRTDFNDPTRFPAALCGIVVRASGTGSSESGYIAALSQATGGVRRLSLRKWVNATSTLEAEVDAAWATSTWTWVEVEMDGTALRARQWAHGTARPTTWAVESTDSSLTSGDVLLYAQTSTAFTATIEFAAVAVRFGAGQVPLPA